jgi:hypothetical protein
MNFEHSYFNCVGTAASGCATPDLQEALFRYRFSDSNAWSPEWPGLLATY